MMRALGLWMAAVAAASGVAGGCAEPEARAMSVEELGARLRALPGVAVEEPDSPSATEAGYHYFLLRVTQPVDHDDPGKGSFQQQVSLLHRSAAADVPMVVQTTGYTDTDRDRTVELTELLAANQVAIEHRYFGSSRPEPCDWSKLTIRQMADDEHAVLAMLHELYAGAFVSVGGSKGGMTAVFHRRFYPDDVAGTVGYVTPISLDAPDDRYRRFLHHIGPPGCREAVRRIAVVMASSARAPLIERARQQPGHAYTLVAVEAAFEAAVAGLEWAFWQGHGVAECDTVPREDASADALFAFLEHVSPVGNVDDEHLLRAQPYYYQSYAELGYPDAGLDEYVGGFLRFGEDAFEATLPTEEPTYRREVMRDIADYVARDARQLLLIYGEWDPWTAGKLVVEPRNDAAVLIVPQGTHASWLASLGLSERELAFAKLERWTGTSPQLQRIRVRRGERDLASAAIDLPPDLVPRSAPIARK